MKKVNRYITDIILVVGYSALVSYLIWFISQ